jgi:CRISPR/Cas system-associated exonuclease Cas4 (RecB family)
MIVNGVSFSSDRKLARCEQQYSYRYEEKIEPKQKKIGLYRGDLGHQLVQAHYTRPGPGWRAKFDQLRSTRWDTLFDEEKEDYGHDFMDTLYELMEHYESYWSEWDKRWEVLNVEQDFTIMTKFGYPVRWKADLVVKETIPTGGIRRIKGAGPTKVMLVEHKFKKKIPEPEERILQPQVHAYAWLLKKKGIEVDSILWDYIRTEPVPRPMIKKDGNLSVRKIATDQRGYLKSLKEAGIEMGNEQEAQALQSHLDTLPKTLSLERVSNSVNWRMGEEFVKQWIERANRAKNISQPLRNWNSDCKFDCDYYLLCQTDMLQKTDRNLVILKNYQSKKREDPLK